MQIPEHFPENPKLLWSYFHTITQIPRPSKQEGKLRDFILSEAQKFSLRTEVDEVGNVIVYVPASAGYEDHQAVIIQNHMDMVTDATPDRVINFSKDPIVTLREGDWLKADRTTLGADNGIGCAAALALMSDKSITHPPLELLFTIDEETGLKGAWGVDGKKLTGKKMLNLDTEEWGCLYIGCAGGIDYEFKRTFSLVPSRIEGTFYKFMIKGFIGGHSGTDIHEQRGNAIRFLMEWLNLLPSGSFEVAEWRGGKAHNIIPRDAWVILKLSNPEQAQESAENLLLRWKSYMPKDDQDFSYSFEALENGPQEVLEAADLKHLINFLLAFPHGAHSYNLDDRKLVALSNNLAISLMVRGNFYLETSLRFFDRKECLGLEDKIVALANGFDIEYSKKGEYPSWKPERENQLLDLVGLKFEELFKIKASVMAIHAGLECGILRDKIGPIDTVSFGPTILGAHSPQERIYIPSVESFWVLLKEVLRSL